jgi:LPS-assembly protein
MIWASSAACAGANGKEDFSGKPVNIEADNIHYEKESDTYRANGNVVIHFSGDTLLADTVILKKQENEIFALDRVKLTSKGDILEGDEIIYNIERKTGTVYNGKVFFAKNHLYLWGNTIEKRSDVDYYVQDVRTTSCDGDVPDWQLTGRELNVTADGYGALSHCKFLVRDVPVFYTPYLIFPAKRERQSGFLFPRFGQSNKNGFDMEVPFYWAISENTDATFYQRYMAKRGFQEGLEFRYALSKDIFGLFYGDYMNDVKRIKESEDNFSRNWQSDHNRWSLYLDHEMANSYGLYMKADIRKISDRWYFKDFSSHNYYRDHYSASSTSDDHFDRVPFRGDESLRSLDSTVRLGKNWESYHLSALARYTDDFASVSNDGTLQKYPEIRFTAIKQPFLHSPLYVDFDGTYDYYYRKEGQKGHLYDLSPAFSLPVDLNHMFQLIPRIGWREVFWDRDDEDNKTSSSPHGNRQIFNGGMSLDTEIYRVFPVGGETIEKIKHEIKSELSYSYISDINQEGCPDFIEGTAPKNVLTYALTNTLMARLKEKDGNVRYVEFMRLKLWQEYDIREARREVDREERARRPFGDIFMELDLTPVQYFHYFSRQCFDVNSGGWKQNNHEVVVNNPRGDSATLGYRYTKDMVEEINFSLTAMITSRLDVAFTLKRNELDQRTVERTYGLNYHRQCWKIQFGLTDTQDDKSFMLKISLFGFGN